VPSTDLPTAIMFILFLMLFLAIGIFPAWQRTAARLRTFLRGRRMPIQPDTGAPEGPAATTFDGERQTLLLNDFDIFILRRLAQADGRGLSRRQLQEALHFDPPLLMKTLASLQERGLVEGVVPIGFGGRFRLSARGRHFAAEQGYLPNIRGMEKPRRPT